MKPLTLPVIFLAALALVSQVRAQPQVNSAHYRAVFHGPFACSAPAIAGAPYSAEQEFERDGQIFREWIFRDSRGRTRTERSMTKPDRGIRLVQIVDPIGGYQYVIDVVNKVAYRIENPPDGCRVKGVVGGSRMINHIAAEPDPALFGPPPDYRLVDEKATFAIDISVPATL